MNVQTVIMARFSSDDKAIPYRTFDLWITTCFQIMDHYGAWRWQHRLRQRAAASSHKFPTYSPGGATLFDFVVVYSGRTLRTGVKYAV